MPGAVAAHRGGALGIPGDAFVAHVLHPHRRLQMRGEHGRIRGRVALVVAAIGAGAEHPDRPHLLARQPQQLGHAVGRVIGLLRAGPHRRLAVAHVGDRAARSGAGMGLGRIFVLALDDARGLLEAVLDRAVLALDEALDHRGVANMRMQGVMAGEIRLGFRPGHLEGLRRLDGVPFLLGHDREQVLDPDHLRARDLRDRAFVDLDRHRARDRRADHAGMQHAGQPHVVDHVQRAEHLAGQIAAAERFADDLELVGRLQRHLDVDRERVRGLAVPVHLAVEIAPADELRIGDAARGVGGCMHHAVRHRELLGRQAERVGGARDQEMARQRRGTAQHHAAVGDPDGGARPAHVEGAAVVAHDHAHVLERQRRSPPPPSGRWRCRAPARRRSCRNRRAPCRPARC